MRLPRRTRKGAKRSRNKSYVLVWSQPYERVIFLFMRWLEIRSVQHLASKCGSAAVQPLMAGSELVSKKCGLRPIPGAGYASPISVGLAGFRRSQSSGLSSSSPQFGQFDDASVCTQDGLDSGYAFLPIMLDPAHISVWPSPWIDPHSITHNHHLRCFIHAASLSFHIHWL